MNIDLINKFSEYVLDSARLGMVDIVESEQPLYLAEKIKKELTEEEYKQAVKKAVVDLLKNNFIAQAIFWVGEFSKVVDLANDQELRNQAEIKYKEAKANQNEIAEDLKKHFKLIDF